MDCSFPWTLAGWLGVIKLQASHPAHQAGWMIDKSAAISLKRLAPAGRDDDDDEI
jgi:hypothetical protein